jgi:hypothetical protein
MLYSKNGSIPKPETDGTEGWVEVPEPPVAPEGMEVVWWCPPGWVTRPIKPVKEGFVYDWSQSEEKWVESAAALTTIEIVIPDGASSNDKITLGSATDTISMGSASDTITGA